MKVVATGDSGAIGGTPEATVQVVRDQKILGRSIAPNTFLRGSEGDANSPFVIRIDLQIEPRMSLERWAQLASENDLAVRQVEALYPQEGDATR